MRENSSFKEQGDTQRALDVALIGAHERGDKARLVTLYREAAGEAGLGTEAGAFFLTQAYVFALETGDSAATTLRLKLVALGREAPLSEDVG